MLGRLLPLRSEASDRLDCRSSWRCSFERSLSCFLYASLSALRVFSASFSSNLRLASRMRSSRLVSSTSDLRETNESALSILVREEGDMAWSSEMVDSPRLLLCFGGEEPDLVDKVERFDWETLLVSLGTMPSSKAVCDWDKGVGAI